MVRIGIRRKAKRKDFGRVAVAVSTDTKDLTTLPANKKETGKEDKLTTLSPLLKHSMVIYSIFSLRR